MAERKAFGMRVARVSSRARRRREAFKIAVNMPRHGPEAGRDPAEQAFDNAAKIFESLVESGRLPKRKG